MGLLDSVLNAQAAAATGKFDTVTLHTASPGTDGSNDDETAGPKTLTWSTASGGVSTASVTWTGITGDWTHLGLWDSTTFVGSVPRTISFPTTENLTVAFQMRVTESA